MAGLFSAISGQPVQNDFRTIAISPGGNRLAYLGGQGVDVVDLQNGNRIAEYRWMGVRASWRGRLPTHDPAS